VGRAGETSFFSFLLIVNDLHNFPCCVAVHGQQRAAKAAKSEQSRQREDNLRAITGAKKHRALLVRSLSGNGGIFEVKFPA